MMEERYQELKAAERGAIVSIISYIFLAIVKLAIGMWARSDALTADGWNNFTDILASVAILIGLRIARRPPDDNHRYGHWKVETVSSMITSFIMLVIGLQVLYNSVMSIVHGKIEEPEPIAAYVGIFSAIVMYAVYFYNKNLAKKMRSGALLAAAKDNRSDAWTSTGTGIAIFASRFHMYWIDNVAAVVIALLILKTAIEIFQESAFSLSDGFSEDQLALYTTELLKIDGVEEVRAIRGRTYGSNIFLDVVILMDPEMTVRKSHEITEKVEQMLKDQFHVFDTDVHVEPYEKINRES